MERHVYQLSGNTKAKKDGEPIGLELSNAIVHVFTLRWDKKFFNKAKENNLKLLLCSRYIDDPNHVIEALPPGTSTGGTERNWLLCKRRDNSAEGA